MAKGNRKDYPCPVCAAKMIMEACGCWTCESCGHVVRPSGVYEGTVVAEGWTRLDIGLCFKRGNPAMVKPFRSVAAAMHVIVLRERPPDA